MKDKSESQQLDVHKIYICIISIVLLNQRRQTAETPSCAAEIDACLTHEWLLLHTGKEGINIPPLSHELSKLRESAELLWILRRHKDPSIDRFNECRPGPDTPLILGSIEATEFKDSSPSRWWNKLFSAHSRAFSSQIPSNGSSLRALMAKLGPVRDKKTFGEQLVTTWAIWLFPVAPLAVDNVETYSTQTTIDTHKRSASFSFKPCVCVWTLWMCDWGSSWCSGRVGGWVNKQERGTAMRAIAVKSFFAFVPSAYD